MADGALPDSAGAMGMLPLPVHHVGYVVEDLERAVDGWARGFGAGPFFFIADVQFDELAHDGREAVWTHAAAFGWWGSIGIELQVLRRVEPVAVQDAMWPTGGTGINHVAIVSDTPERESAALTAAGYPAFLHATGGPLEMVWHDTRALLGHATEIHRRCDFLVDNFARFEAAARAWDGRDPLRPLA